MSAYPFEYVHRGYDGCGEAAFLVTHRPLAGDRLLSLNAADLLEHPIEAGSAVTCGNCGKQIGPARVENVRERSTRH